MYLTEDKIKRIEEIKEVIESSINDYDYYGIRFEDKEYKIGDICFNSKSNTNREDERDFPEFGSEEYNELEELDGTCAWSLYNRFTKWSGGTDHCYLIGGHYAEDGEDLNELIIRDAEIIEIIF